MHVLHYFLRFAYPGSGSMPDFTLVDWEIAFVSRLMQMMKCDCLSRDRKHMLSVPIYQCCRSLGLYAIIGCYWLRRDPNRQESRGLDKLVDSSRLLSCLRNSAA